jgi:hypothetical protein
MCSPSHRRLTWFLRLVMPLLLLVVASALPVDAEPVVILRLPGGGMQPQAATDSEGVLHLIYLKGDPGQADVYYLHSADQGRSFSKPIRVNSQEGSATATGTIRGPQLALGRNGKVHVAWNGSSIALPKGPLNPALGAENPHNGTPMLYARLNDAGTAFEPQRNLMQHTFGLDGGGSVAADLRGNVYVGWHGSAMGDAAGEAGRRVWIARSADDGGTFAPEAPASSTRTGACGCCGLRLFTAKDGRLYALFRSATNDVHRDIYLLASAAGAGPFQENLLHKWDINACPMSSMAFSEGASGILAAWETQEQIYFTSIEPRGLGDSEPTAAPGTAVRRKHPSLAQNQRRETLLVWTEGTGWNKGGSLAWQVFDPNGKPLGGVGRSKDVPTWSFGAAFAMPDGRFGIVY